MRHYCQAICLLVYRNHCSDAGLVTGSTKGVDIDAFGFGTSDWFRFFRLRDDPSEDTIDGIDIDAISSTVVPVPAAVWLYASALILLGRMRRAWV